MWEVGGFWRNGTIDSFISRYVLESLTVTYRSLTWRSRAFQYVSVSLSMSDQPYAVFLSRHLQRMCHLIVLLHLKAASELKHFQLWVQPERGWVWNNTFWDIWVWKLLLYQERKKKHAVFLLCHIVVLTVIFNMWWLCAKENEGLVSRRSRAQLTLLRLIHCRLCWCLRERDIWFCTHWFPMCHVLFFFFWGVGVGGGGTSAANVKF